MSSNQRPNVLFIIIDSLRVDRIFGPMKSAKTPNLDKLIKNGAFFDQTIASSDTTFLNVGSIFTSQYPFKSGINVYKNHKKTQHFFQTLSKNGYFRCATVPNTTFFRTLTHNFENIDFIGINPNQSLENGIDEKISQQIQTNLTNTPWIHYIHLLDLHPTKKRERRVM